MGQQAPNRAVACPRCGTAMTYRLAEYECPQCGYFVSAKALERGEPSPAATAGGAVLLPRPAGRRGLARVEDSERAARRWLALKQTYLLVLYFGLTGGTLLQAQLVPNFTITGHFILAVALAGLVACGLAALALFIDWLAFRMFVQVLAVLLLGFCGYEMYLWNGQDQLRLVLIAFNALLILGLAVLNQFDIMNMS